MIELTEVRVPHRRGAVAEITAIANRLGVALVEIEIRHPSPAKLAAVQARHPSATPTSPTLALIVRTSTVPRFTTALACAGFSWLSVPRGS